MFEHSSLDQHGRAPIAHDAATGFFTRSSANHRPASELVDEMARQLLAEAR